MSDKEPNVEPTPKPEKPKEPKKKQPENKGIPPLRRRYS